jgi:hypothetical protein
MTGLHMGFRVPPQSKNKIQTIANNARAALNLPAGPLDAERLLERLHAFGIVVDVFDRASAPVPKEVEACWVPSANTLYIRDTVYADICSGGPRGRFTVAHELGHIILAHQTTANRESSAVDMKKYENSEWQANTFASEFLMPESEIRFLNLRTPQAVEKHFKVSYQAAEIRVKNVWGMH